MKSFTFIYETKNVNTVVIYSKCTCTNAPIDNKINKIRNRDMITLS